MNTVQLVDTDDYEAIAAWLDQGVDFDDAVNFARSGDTPESLRHLRDRELLTASS